MADGYSEEDAQEILRRALMEKGTDDPRFTHDELKKAAEEIGVDGQRFELAALTLKDERAAEKNLAQRQLKKREQFTRRAGFVAIASVFLYLLAGTSGWFTYPVGIMGFFLALRAFRTFFPQSREKKSLLLQQETDHVRMRREQEDEQRKERIVREQRRALAEKKRATMWSASENAFLSILAFIQQTFRTDTIETGRARPPNGREGPVSPSPPPREAPLVTPPPKLRVDPADRSRGRVAREQEQAERDSSASSKEFRRQS